ncbi:AI-2E family transporter [Geotalea toluenoxydans]
MRETPERKSFLSHVLVASLALLLLSGYFIHHTLSALLTSLVLAYLLNPLLKYLERKGLGRLPALGILYVALAVILTVSFFILVPYLGHQLQTLKDTIPYYVLNLKGELTQWQFQLSPYYSGEEGIWLLQRGKESFDRMTQALSGLGYNRLTAIFYGIFNLILAPILIFFMLLYKQMCKDMVKRLIPLGHRRQMIDLGRRINSSLERFILGMAIDCTLVAILTAFALWMLDIQFAVLNGLLAGFASVVPILGVTIAVIPPLLIGYAQTGDISVIAKVCLLYFIINVIIEGNLIKPLVMRHTLRLNPLVVIFAVMAMGELMGFWGIVLAIPLAAVMKICAGEFRNRGTA